MKAKTFVWAVLAAVLGVLGALALVLALTDPFFVVRGLDEEDTALFSNQRYEMAGLIRNQDYSAVVMGTSLVANYRASWFTEGLGKETLKITFPDGWLSEFDTALHLAYQTHPELDTVFFGLDLNILIRPDSQRDVELPMYLYNTNPFDDVQYFLNKETYIQVAKLLVNRLNGGTTTLDNAYVWDGSHEFSREHSLEVYYRLPDGAGGHLPGCGKGKSGGGHRLGQGSPGHPVPRLVRPLLHPLLGQRQPAGPDGRLPGGAGAGLAGADPI